MRFTIFRTRRGLVHLIFIAISLGMLAGASAQSNQKKENSQRQDSAQDETIKIDTNLVTVPVIASDRNDIYTPDLKQDEFKLFEDGVAQEIVFFATVKEPFHVVLMLDTSASAQAKLGQIQTAAKAFVNQLQEQDRVKVISFDDQVRELCRFTNDRDELREAIGFARSGEGTKLYDAVKLALNTLARVKGRKAIVIFTDGVDSYSDATRYDDNMQQIEESGVIVYPIRYDTRPETEAMIRNQQEMLGQVDLGTIFGGPNSRGPRGGTPPITPGDSGSRVPSGRGGNDPYRLPIPPITIPLPGSRYPDRYPNPGGGRYPDDRYPDNRYPDNRYPDNRNPSPGSGRYPDNRYPDDRRYPDSRSPGESPYPDMRRPPSSNDPSGYPDSRRRQGDSIGVMLDGMYRTGDDYLIGIALKSGGQLHRADTLRDLPAAFAKIADELRNQYSLGYYPANAARDGKYRKIQVKTTRPQTVLRARPGYRPTR